MGSLLPPASDHGSNQRSEEREREHWIFPEANPQLLRCGTNAVSSSLLKS
jgi:hypothetical protein